jgi:hypothetical protein
MDFLELRKLLSGAGLRLQLLFGLADLRRAQNAMRFASVLLLGATFSKLPFAVNNLLQIFCIGP